MSECTGCPLVFDGELVCALHATYIFQTVVHITPVRVADVSGIETFFCIFCMGGGGGGHPSGTNV